jgi:hypothetical protein
MDDPRMTDIAAAAAFMATHARLIDRHRLDLLLHDAPPDGALAALAAHGNPDGGFGWGLEPDLRSPASQPVGAMHAFEVLEDIAPARGPLAGPLCDWLDAVTLPDGGLPFALSGAEGPGSAPWWASADPTASSLHITSAVCGHAHRVAIHDPVVAGHGWLDRATGYCLRQIAALTEPRGGYELMYVLQLLDALAETRPDVEGELERLARFVPPSGELPVQGGLPDETLRPLFLSPRPGRPLRDHVPGEAIAGDLERLAGEQGPDGGWNVDFAPGSPAAALEWRGYATVRALALLRAHGR